MQANPSQTIGYGMFPNVNMSYPILTEDAPIVRNERNAEIFRLSQDGVDMEDIAEAFELSRQRIHDIVAQERMYQNIEARRQSQCLPVTP